MTSPDEKYLTSQQGDKYLSYCRGWRHAAAGHVKHPAFCEVSTPAELRAEYELGYSDGKKASREMSERASERLGYKPTVLRAI